MHSSCERAERAVLETVGPCFASVVPDPGASARTQPMPAPRETLAKPMEC